jgi:predicted nucleic-acid-binding Zn-ribbon protein
MNLLKYLRGKYVELVGEKLDSPINSKSKCPSCGFHLYKKDSIYINKEGEEARICPKCNKVTYISPDKEVTLFRHMTPQEKKIVEEKKFDEMFDRISDCIDSKGNPCLSKKGLKILLYGP